MQRRFVRHRELAYITRMVGQFCVECIFAPSQRFGESAVKVGDELLVSSHKADEVGYIVWHVPAVNPAVVFSIILTGSHASGETVVEWLNPLSFLIFRMEESGFFIVEIPVVIRTFQIVFGFFFLVQSLGDTGETPLVVAGSQSDSDRLALLERMYVRVVFRFIYTESGDITVFTVEIVQPAGRCSRPRGERLFFNPFPASLVGFCRVYFQPFGQCVGYRGNGMIGVHATCVTCYFGESRHPHIAHLFRHAQVGCDDVFFLLLVDQCAERMCGTVSVPNPVVGVERSTVVFVYLSIEGAEVTAVFAHADGTFEGTVERRVEYGFVIFRSSFYLDTSQRFVPDLASRFCQCFDVIVF